MISRLVKAAIGGTPRVVDLGANLSTPRAVLFEDRFDTVSPGQMADPNKWYYVTGGLGWGDGELQAYRRSEVNGYITADQKLAIVAHEEPGEGGANYTSARLETRWANDPFLFTYGRVEARIKVPAGQGMFAAFWTCGDYEEYGYPGYGEIDVVETINDADVARFHSHQPGWTFGVNSPVHPSGSWANDFHVYAVEWTEDSLTWLVDGVTYAVQYKDDLPGGASWVLDDRPQGLVLNLAVGGSWAGPPDETTEFPATMLVDWVRVLAPVEE
jgi:beta-glucanase (GH16 family)